MCEAHSNVFSKSFLVVWGMPSNAENEIEAGSILGHLSWYRSTKMADKLVTK